MRYNDETDRYCPTCHGTRRLTDTSRHEYGYSAHSTTTCWACATPPEPEVIPSKDDLIAAAIAKLAAACGMTASEYLAAEYAMDHGEAL